VGTPATYYFNIAKTEAQLLVDELVVEPSIW
jgi:hypothetical protein